MIYLDNAATTALTPSVIEKMTNAMTSNYGNPSSIHTFGRQANQLLRECRQIIAEYLNVNSREIIFTSGGTESNNTAIKGYALANQLKGKHIITSEIEHHSVLHTMTYLSERFGFDITYLKPNHGQITAKDVQEALRDDTIMVSLMFANNETGDFLPIQEIGQLLRNHQAVFHVDAVQVFSKMELDPHSLGIDFLAASAHKFHGPKGVGILYCAPHHFDSLLHGGDQEEKRRASTENIISIAGMSQALTDATTNTLKNWTHISQLRTTFLDAISDLDFYLNNGQDCLPHVLNIGFPGQNNGLLLTQLDLAGFAVSTGSACTAGTVEPSHVLTSLYGANSPRLNESIRISFSELNTQEEILELAKTLRKIIGD